MTVLDQVRKLEREVIDRLQELEPLIREYEELRDIAQRLELDYTPGSAGSASPAPAHKATTARRKTGAKRASAKTTSARASARKAAAKPRGRRAASKKAPTQAKARASGAEDGGAGTVAPAARKRSAKKAARRRGVARPGERDAQVVQVVSEQPGITVREIGQRLGVDATGLYRVVNRLTDDGRLRKDGTSLHAVRPTTATPAPAP